jgi:dTDP-L-rhamnose 4-epimerase
MRVLVTGGAGFIGSHVVDALLADGHEVRVLDALLPAAHGPDAALPAWLDPRAEVTLGDVRDPAAVAACLHGIDAVCHQAAMVGLGVDLDDLPAYAGCNDLGTAVVLAAMARAGVGRLVLASSMVVYGEGRYSCAEHRVVRPGARREADLASGRFEPPCPVCDAALRSEVVPEDAPLDPRNTYAATKVAQEHLAAAWARASGGSAVALRYHNVYGPRMPRDTPYAGVASIFRSALAAGRAPRVFEDGGQRRDFVHVADVARANLAALTADAESGALRAYNVASGTPHTVGDLAAELARAAGGPEPEVTGEYRLGDVRHVVAAPDRARDELGFRASVSFADGVSEFAVAPLRGDAGPRRGAAARPPAAAGAPPHGAAAAPRTADAAPPPATGAAGPPGSPAAPAPLGDAAPPRDAAAAPSPVGAAARPAAARRGSASAAAPRRAAAAPPPPSDAAGTPPHGAAGPPRSASAAPSPARRSAAAGPQPGGDAAARPRNGAAGRPDDAAGPRPAAGDGSPPPSPASAPPTGASGPAGDGAA